MKTTNKKSHRVGLKRIFESIFLIVLKWLNECLTFLFILLKPANLISAGFSIFAIYYSQTQTGTNRIIFEIIGALLSTFTGGIITYYFIEYLGNSSLVKKSVGAIRNLQLIKYKVNNISIRINDLIKLDNKRDFEEIDNLVQNVHKDILNSINDWGDVNPKSEAITDFNEIVLQKENAIKLLNKDKKILEEEKKNLTDDKTQRIDKLSKDIDNKNEEIKKLEKQLSDFNERNIGLLSGSYISGPTGPAGPISFGSQISDFGTTKTFSILKCSRCKKNYTHNDLYLDMGLCPSCQAEVSV